MSGVWRQRVASGQAWQSHGTHGKSEIEITGDIMERKQPIRGQHGTALTNQRSACAVFTSSDTEHGRDIDADTLTSH